MRCVAYPRAAARERGSVSEAVRAVAFGRGIPHIVKLSGLSGIASIGYIWRRSSLIRRTCPWRATFVLLWNEAREERFSRAELRSEDALSCANLPEVIASRRAFRLASRSARRD